MNEESDGAFKFIREIDNSNRDNEEILDNIYMMVLNAEKVSENNIPKRPSDGLIRINRTYIGVSLISTEIWFEKDGAIITDGELYRKINKVHASYIKKLYEEKNE